MPWVKILGILAAIGRWLYELGRRHERVDLEKEQRDLAEAMQRDFDEIGNDGRTLDDALGRLRRKSGSPRDVP